MIFKKVPGFSLMEVLFNLILIVIVIGSGYLGYEFAFNDMSLFNKANTDLSEFVQFNNAFIIDQSRCSTIIREGENLELNCDSVPVHYTFNENCVVRKYKLVSDTFLIRTLSFSSSFDSKEKSSGLIEKGSLVLECMGKKLISTFNKTYDSYQLIQANLSEGVPVSIGVNEKSIEENGDPVR